MMMMMMSRMLDIRCWSFSAHVFPLGNTMRMNEKQKHKWKWNRKCTSTEFRVYMYKMIGETKGKCFNHLHFFFPFFFSCFLLSGLFDCIPLFYQAFIIRFVILTRHLADILSYMLKNWFHFPLNGHIQFNNPSRCIECAISIDVWHSWNKNRFGTSNSKGVWRCQMKYVLQFTYLLATQE